MSDGGKRRVLTRYEGYGLVAGFAAGLLLGVLLSGPHFKEWSALQSFLVVAGGAALGSLTGFLAVWIVMGSLAGGGAGGSIGSGDGSHGGGGHGGGDGASSDG
jgi:hypothetical protein